MSGTANGMVSSTPHSVDNDKRNNLNNKENLNMKDNMNNYINNTNTISNSMTMPITQSQRTKTAAESASQKSPIKSQRPPPRPHAHSPYHINSKSHHPKDFSSKDFAFDYYDLDSPLSPKHVEFLRRSEKLGMAKKMKEKYLSNSDNSGMNQYQQQLEQGSKGQKIKQLNLSNSGSDIGNDFDSDSAGDSDSDQEFQKALRLEINESQLSSSTKIQDQSQQQKVLGPQDGTGSGQMQQQSQQQSVQTHNNVASKVFGNVFPPFPRRDHQLYRDPDYEHRLKRMRNQMLRELQKAKSNRDPILVKHLVENILPTLQSKLELARSPPDVVLAILVAEQRDPRDPNRRKSEQQSNNNNMEDNDNDLNDNLNDNIITSSPSLALRALEPGILKKPNRTRSPIGKGRRASRIMMHEAALEMQKRENEAKDKRESEDIYAEGDNDKENLNNESSGTAVVTSSSTSNSNLNKSEVLLSKMKKAAGAVTSQSVNLQKKSQISQSNSKSQSSNLELGPHLLYMHSGILRNRLLNPILKAESRLYVDTIPDSEWDSYYKSMQKKNYKSPRNNQKTDAYSNFDNILRSQTLTKQSTETAKPTDSQFQSTKTIGFVVSAPVPDMPVQSAGSALNTDRSANSNSQSGSYSSNNNYSVGEFQIEDTPREDQQLQQKQDQIIDQEAANTLNNDNNSSSSLKSVSISEQQYNNDQNEQGVSLGSPTKIKPPPLLPFQNEQPQSNSQSGPQTQSQTIPEVTLPPRIKLSLQLKSMVNKISRICFSHAFVAWLDYTVKHNGGGGGRQKPTKNLAVYQFEVEDLKNQIQQQQSQSSDYDSQSQQTKKGRANSDQLLQAGIQHHEFQQELEIHVRQSIINTSRTLGKGQNGSNYGQSKSLSNPRVTTIAEITNSMTNNMSSSFCRSPKSAVAVASMRLKYQMQASELDQDVDENDQGILDMKFQELPLSSQQQEIVDYSYYSIQDQLATLENLKNCRLKSYNNNSSNTQVSSSCSKKLSHLYLKKVYVAKESKDRFILTISGVLHGLNVLYHYEGENWDSTIGDIPSNEFASTLHFFLMLGCENRRIIEGLRRYMTSKPQLACLTLVREYGYDSRRVQMGGVCARRARAYLDLESCLIHAFAHFPNVERYIGYQRLDLHTKLKISNKRVQLLEKSICEPESDNPRRKTPFPSHFRDVLPPIMVESDPLVPKPKWQRMEESSYYSAKGYKGYRFLEEERKRDEKRGIRGRRCENGKFSSSQSNYVPGSFGNDQGIYLNSSITSGGGMKK